MELRTVVDGGDHFSMFGDWLVFRADKPIGTNCSQCPTVTSGCWHDYHATNAPMIGRLASHVSVGCIAMFFTSSIVIGRSAIWLQWKDTFGVLFLWTQSVSFQCFGVRGAVPWSVMMRTMIAFCLVLCCNSLLFVSNLCKRWSTEWSPN